MIIQVFHLPSSSVVGEGEVAVMVFVVMRSDGTLIVDVSRHDLPVNNLRVNGLAVTDKAPSLLARHFLSGRAHGLYIVAHSVIVIDQPIVHGIVHGEVAVSQHLSLLGFDELHLLGRQIQRRRPIGGSANLDGR